MLVSWSDSRLSDGAMAESNNGVLKGTIPPLHDHRYAHSHHAEFNKLVYYNATIVPTTLLQYLLDLLPATARYVHPNLYTC